MPPSGRCGTSRPGSSTSTPGPRAPRRTCHSAAGRRPATATARPATRRSTRTPSGSRSTSTSAAGSSAPRLTTSSDTVEIRPRAASDFEALVELDLASARHHAGLDPEFYRVPERAAVAEFLARRLTDPDREVLVALVDGEVVGTVDVTLVEPPDPGSIVRPVPTADLG